LGRGGRRRDAGGVGGGDTAGGAVGARPAPGPWLWKRQRTIRPGRRWGEVHRPRPRAPGCLGLQASQLGGGVSAWTPHATRRALVPAWRAVPSWCAVCTSHRPPPGPIFRKRKPLLRRPPYVYGGPGQSPANATGQGTGTAYGSFEGCEHLSVEASSTSNPGSTDLALYTLTLAAGENAGKVGPFAMWSQSGYAALTGIVMAIDTALPGASVPATTPVGQPGNVAWTPA